MGTNNHRAAILELIRFICITLYSVSSLLILMSIRKFWIARDKFFVHLRHPLSSIFFISICLICNILNLTECISRYYIYETEWGFILFLTFNSLRITGLMYTLYIIFHAIIQQYNILNRVTNPQNNIQRLVAQLMEATATNSTQHQNMIRSILIIYNIFMLIVAILSSKVLSEYSVTFGYNLLLTPQLMLLDALTVLMYQHTPSQYEDMFDLKKQWNHIVFGVLIPLNIMLFLFYLFPSHFGIIHTVCDLILLYKYIWSISTYPITLHLKSQRQLASMQYPPTWQEFLCQRDEKLQLLDIPTDDAISYINNHMFHSENMNTVSPVKLELFMREFGNPDDDKCCVSELLFVSELSQIKSQIISIIGPAATDECGLIISIPNGLLPSCLISTHLSQWFDSINVDNIYDIMARLFLKYMDYYTATVSICHSVEIHKLDIVYDKLITEYPQTMCLTQPMTEYEVSTSRSPKQEDNDNNNWQNEYKYSTTDDPETFVAPFTNDIHSEIALSQITSTGINAHELQNIYRLVRTYDDILSDCSIKVQNCYQHYKSRNMEHSDDWRSIVFSFL